MTLKISDKRGYTKRDRRLSVQTKAGIKNGGGEAVTDMNTSWEKLHAIKSSDNGKLPRVKSGGHKPWFKAPFWASDAAKHVTESKWTHYVTWGSRCWCSGLWRGLGEMKGVRYVGGLHLDLTPATAALDCLPPIYLEQLAALKSCVRTCVFYLRLVVLSYLPQGAEYCLLCRCDWAFFLR